jgi:hypothetical protein
MMVAWHEVPGNRPIKIRPVGYGMIVSPLSRRQRAYTVPYGTDSPPRDSRHFVPGHHHLVPSGHNRLTRR